MTSSAHDLVDLKSMGFSDARLAECALQRQRLARQICWTIGVREGVVRLGSHGAVLAVDLHLHVAEVGGLLRNRVGAEPRAYWGAYASSKAALESLVLSYALEVEKTALRVNLLNPGGTRTAMRARAMPGEDPLSLPSTKDVATKAVQMVLPEWQRSGERLHLDDLSS